MGILRRHGDHDARLCLGLYLVRGCGRRRRWGRISRILRFRVQTPDLQLCSKFLQDAFIVVFPELFRGVFTADTLKNYRQSVVGSSSVLRIAIPCSVDARKYPSETTL